MWLIKRLDQGGGYLAFSGSASSYTHKLENARTFHTKEAAEAECCPENERPVRLDSIMRGAR